MSEGSPQMMRMPATSKIWPSMLSTVGARPRRMSLSAMLSVDLRRVLMVSMGLRSYSIESSSLSTRNLVSTSMRAHW